MFGVQRASLSMFWEYSPSSANLASDWAESKESSPVDEEEIKIKMDDDVDTSSSKFVHSQHSCMTIIDVRTSFASETTDLIVDLWEAQPCFWDPE